MYEDSIDVMRFYYAVGYYWGRLGVDYEIVSFHKELPDPKLEPTERNWFDMGYELGKIHYEAK